ncbi:hypothetical protein JMN32_13870 [Fulvivirga sp. 29W222]|uniref:Uncharacterized protein n=1 Tax=Fulvivirga marina TaxID=2494733 RepID=A0A937FWE9_9BACT|nr:hypothetical protein [Fulvivirga marina]MBL6447400.1 hypothetical protein [Fulvivirga marina]
MLKKTLILLSILAVAAFMLYSWYDKPLPEGVEGPEAELLADKMLKAVNFEAWDSTVAVKWSFYRGHDFLWDKKRDLVEVKWDDMRVLLNTNSQSGKAFQGGILLSGNEAIDALQMAWEYFTNDSFWLAAPFKARDPGTKRSIVKTEHGDALLVQYTSGGVTPGDSYLWLLNEDGLPVAWKLWVKIIPLGGMKFSWDGWQTYTTGARISSFHHGVVNVEVSGVELAMSAADLNNGHDPFAEM